MPVEIESQPAPSPWRDRAPTTIAGALLGLSMLLLLRRYWGLDHDSALYLGQALLKRWPEIYAHDLFFAHGSQGSYTLFPWLVAQAMEHVEPSTLFRAGALLGLLLFATAGWFAL